MEGGEEGWEKRERIRGKEKGTRREVGCRFAFNFSWNCRPWNSDTGGPYWSCHQLSLFPKWQVATVIFWRQFNQNMGHKFWSMYPYSSRSSKRCSIHFVVTGWWCWWRYCLVPVALAAVAFSSLFFIYFCLRRVVSRHAVGHTMIKRLSLLVRTKLLKSGR